MPLQKVVAGGGPVLEQRLATAVHEAAVLPALAAPSAGAAPPPQDVRGSADSSLSLATGIGPAPAPSHSPTAAPPLFPGGTWSPLPPGASPPPDAASQPPSPSSAALRVPPLSVAKPAWPPGDEAPPGQWSPGASGVPERPTSVRFRPPQDAAGREPATGAGPHVSAGGSLVKRSASWRGQDSTASVRFREGAAPSRDGSPEGAMAAGPARMAGGGSLRDSQRNLLDSVASPGRGLAASQDPSTWQVRPCHAPTAARARTCRLLARRIFPCVIAGMAEALRRGRMCCVLQMSSLAEVQDADSVGEPQQDDLDDGERPTRCRPGRTSEQAWRSSTGWGCSSCLLLR